MLLLPLLHRSVTSLSSEIDSSPPTACDVFNHENQERVSSVRDSVDHVPCGKRFLNATEHTVNNLLLTFTCCYSPRAAVHLKYGRLQQNIWLVVTWNGNGYWRNFLVKCWMTAVQPKRASARPPSLGGPAPSTFSNLRTSFVAGGDDPSCNML